MTTTTKTSASATHRGTCQICGRAHKVNVKRGTLAKHGYRVVGEGWGGRWFSGACYGSHKLPLQVDRKLADQMVADLRAGAEQDDALAAKIEAGEYKPEMIEGRGYRAEPVRFEDASEYDQRQALDLLRYKANARARNARAHADYVEKLADAIHGTELIAIPESEKAEAEAAKTRKPQAEMWVRRVDVNGRIGYAATIWRFRQRSRTQTTLRNEEGRTMVWIDRDAAVAAALAKIASYGWELKG